MQASIIYSREISEFFKAASLKKTAVSVFYQEIIDLLNYNINYQHEFLSNLINLM